MTIIDTEKTFVPNWFEKEHIEGFIRRNLTDDEWDDFLEEFSYDLNEWLTHEVKMWVVDCFPSEEDDGGQG